MNGQTLKFRLSGINNQNFLMTDEQTGSWWQQISGEAIQGPLQGESLESVGTDELTFGTWKLENPDGIVLRPDPNILAQQKYEPANWEEEVARLPVTTFAELDSSLEPRTIVVGVSVAGRDKAYPLSSVEKQAPILDTVGTTDIVILLADDGRSVRAFERIVAGKRLEFLRNPHNGEIVDAETASVWDFTGLAVSGPLQGSRLTKIPVLKDYWFDWKTYHPGTQLYTLGIR